MDLDGVYASVNFPSALLGFAGQRLQRETDDPELALALIRANNDWHKEVWTDAYPDRIIPCQVPYLLDPEVGAAEIRRNAARGFKAVTFPEAPEKLGLPSLHTGYWDPVDAGVRGDRDGHLPAHRLVVEPAVDLVGRSRRCDRRAGVRLRHVLGGRLAVFDDSGALSRTSRSPCPKAESAGCPACSTGSTTSRSYHDIYGTWHDKPLTPAEVFQRNFWHCALDDPSVFQLRHRIGIDRILMEADYPHLDSSWPRTQQVLDAQVGGFPPAEPRLFTWQNASELFRHPVPDSIAQDADAF